MAYHPKSDFLHAINERGFIADCTDLQGLDEALIKGVVPAYIGYDLTASSLHIGSLVQIMLLRWLQKTGHKPITLMGGGTTKVGDPSGKTNAQADLGRGDQRQCRRHPQGVRPLSHLWRWADRRDDAQQCRLA